MDEIELDFIIMFLRGRMPLNKLLKYIKIDGFGTDRNSLKYSLEQLIDIRDNDLLALKFKRNWTTKIKGYRFVYRNELLDMKKNGEDITKKLKEYKKILPKSTYYRLKNDLKLAPDQNF